MRKNVASQIVGGQLNSKTDGSAVTSGSTVVYITGDGGTQAAGSVALGSCTHEGQGFWTYAPAQAETNYDHVAFTFVNSSAVNATVQIYPSFPQTVDNATNISAIKTKTDFLPSATAGAAGGVFIAGSNAATSITTALTANVIGNVTGNLSGSVGSVTGNVGGNVVGSVASVTARVTANTDQLAGQTVTAAAGVTFPTSVASPTNITAGTITTVTNLTNAPTAGDFTATMKASINTEADTALADYDAPTNAEMVARTLAAASYSTASALATAQTGIDDLPTNAELATALDPLPTAAENADAVWDEALAGHAGAGSAGLALSNATAPSAATVADAVWDEALSGHAGVGSAGAALSAAGSAGDPWSTALPGAYGAGTAGKIVGDNINATIGSRATQTSVDDVPTNAELATALGAADDAVLAAVATAQTAIDAIPTNAELATALGTADDAVLTQVALVKAKTDLIPASPAAVGDVTGIMTAAMTESYAADGATMTPAQAFYMIWALLAERNLVSTTLTANKLDGTTPAMTFTTDNPTSPTTQTRST